MITSSVDFLYVTLAVAIILIGILFAIALLYLIFILRDISRTTYFLRDTLQQINDFVYRPISIANSIIEKIGPILEAAQKRGIEAMEACEESETTKKKKKRGRPPKKK